MNLRRTPTRMSPRTLLLPSLSRGLVLLAFVVAVPATPLVTASSEQVADPDAEASVVSLKVPAVDHDGEVTKSADPHGEHAGEGEIVAELTSERTAEYGLLGVTWQAGYDAPGLVVEVRTLADGTWSPWSHLEFELDGVDRSETRRDGASELPRAGTAPTWVGDADGVSVRLLSPTGEAPEDVRVDLIDGGEGLAMEPAAGTVQLQTAAAESTYGIPPRPTIVTRKQWGVNTKHQSSCESPVSAPTMSAVVLHHTVNSNDYTKAEAPGVVRAIHLYHTKSRGWCDVGYNFLVDRFGTIYQGRRGGIEKQIRGAHAGNWDVNTYTTGISMIGNFETINVPYALRDAVVSLMAWRLASFGVDPMGTATFGGKKMPAISGHRDVHKSGIRPATATACPGKYADTWLNSSLRDDVQRVMDEAGAPDVRRVAGADRYATAASVARSAFSGPGGAVFLASGEGFPDALSGGPAAAKVSAPVLLSRRDDLPSDTATALDELDTAHIVILGGRASVSSAVESEVGRYATEVTRISGKNRFATAVAVSKAVWQSGSGVVYVASGESFPDALSGGALAAHEGAPILLSRTDELPGVVSSEISRLQPSRVVLLGGEAALSEEVAMQIQAASPGVTVDRLAGADRYETSAAVARAGWGSSTRGYFAAGSDFPDALAGVPAAAKSGAPLLLTRRGCLPPTVADAADLLGIHERVLIGGTSVLAKSAATKRCTG